MKYLFPFISIFLFFSSLVTSSSDELFYAIGNTGRQIANLKQVVRPWEEKTGHSVTFVPMPSSSSEQFGQYRLWLAAGSSEIDIYQTDVVWAAQLGDYFVDMMEHAVDLIPQHFPQVIASQTVKGRLIALPLFADAPVLYYRKDLLEKYGKSVPNSWSELFATAMTIQDAERTSGHKDLWGYVWQGGAYEGLTCTALEWISSFGGGHIIENNGDITVNNPRSVAALEQLVSWIGTISPKGVLAYKEEEARGVWQIGNAVFMRNWNYTYGLSAAEHSFVRDKFAVAPLPGADIGSEGTSTLGGWNIAISKFSKKQEIAISLVRYLSSKEGQKRYVLLKESLPTIAELYEDPEVVTAVPMVIHWKHIFLSAVPRPSAPTGKKYNEVSSKIWTSVHNTLSRRMTAADSLETLEADLLYLRGSGW